MQQTVTVYRRTPRGEWRWRIQSRNRKIVGASSEGFKRLIRCIQNLEMVTGIDLAVRRFKKNMRFRVDVGTRHERKRQVVL